MKIKQVLINHKSFYEIARLYPSIARDILVRWETSDLHVYIRTLCFGETHYNLSEYVIHHLQQLDDHHKALYNLYKIDDFGNFVVLKRPLQLKQKKLVEYNENMWADTSPGEL